MIPKEEIEKLISQYKKQKENTPTTFGGEYMQGVDAQIDTCIDDLTDILKKYK